MAYAIKRRTGVILLGTFIAGFAGAASAATVIVNPDGTHRILAGDLAFANGGQNNHFGGTFSTFNGNGTQRTLLKTTNATFLAAFAAALGPSPGYQINSAVLVAGSDADNYAATGPAFRVLRSWDADDVTWNDPDPNDSLTAVPWGAQGVQSGTDYATLPLTNGIILGNTTEFQGLGSTLQSWLNGGVANNGLFFTETGGGSADFTGEPFWRLEVVVPEPGSIALLSIIAGVGLQRQRRKVE